MNSKDHIVSDKEILPGKPTIKRTRISVEYIVGLLAQGWGEAQALENYSRLTKESLQAVFAYIQECIHDGLLFSPIKSPHNYSYEAAGYDVGCTTFDVRCTWCDVDTGYLHPDTG
jgi:uncharacterized protein (DUF433 family)